MLDLQAIPCRVKRQRCSSGIELLYLLRCQRRPDIIQQRGGSPSDGPAQITVSLHGEAQHDIGPFGIPPPVLSVTVVTKQIQHAAPSPGLTCDLVALAEEEVGE